MAGWSGLKNGSVLGFGDVNKNNTFRGSSVCCPNTNGVKSGGRGGGVNNSGDGCEVKLRCLFDQVLNVFWNKSASKGHLRPVCEKLPDGKSMDLFKLFWVVKRRGGYHMVNCFWTFVMKQLGLDLKFSALVKLVYFKYLYGFEKWSRRKCKNGKKGNGDCQCEFCSFFVELEANFRIWESRGFDQKKKDNKLPLPECKKKDKPSDTDSRKRKIGSLDTKDVHGMSNGVGNRSSDDNERFRPKQKKCSNANANDVVILDPSAGKKEYSSRKRKHEPLSRMLNWMIEVAKCPLDPSIGKIPPQSKWKSHSGNELWILALRARETLLQIRQLDSNGKQSLSQKNQKMHPFSCDKTDSENGVKKQTRVADKCLTFCLSEDEDFQRHVAVGTGFQVDVPKWTGVVSESDSKWLGTKVWPWGDGDHKGIADTIGKGRPDSCDCQLPGSVGCIRYHIAEKRMKLKPELGSVFYFWHFDRMGEDVSLRWTAHEEKRFVDMVRSTGPSQGKSFLDIAHKYFPRKTREDLVSYYFNVFLARCRSYQNRMTPDHIDSDDDDELEFGSFGNCYGHEAVQGHGANMLMCSENKQHTSTPEN